MSRRKTLHELQPDELPSAGGHVAGFGILVEVEYEAEVEEDSKLITPEATEADMRGACRGIIRQIGPLAGRDPGDHPDNWGIELGATVFFDRYQGAYYAVAGSQQRYIIIHEKHIQYYVPVKRRGLCQKMTKKLLRSLRKIRKALR